jgi:hypothetical protein
VARLTYPDTTDSGTIKKLVHLRIMRKDKAFFSKSAVRSNGYEKAVIRIDPGGSRKPDIRTEAHSTLSELSPTTIQSFPVKLRFDQGCEIY